MYSILLTVTLVVTCTLAARLDNVYLPPRGTAGSGAGFVSAPFGGAGGGAFGPGGGAYGGFGPGAGGFGGGPQIPIVSYTNNPNLGDGSYSYSYETGNGIAAQESGHQSSVPGPEGPGTAAQGSYSYKGPDGQTYTVTYTADENGFQPQGAHLPTPPPIPPEILKSLQLQGAGGFGGTGAYSGGFGGTGAYSGGTYLAPHTGFGHGRPGYHYKK
ncbi:uncharacterized protein [Rhodnius prolixus]